MPEHVLLERDPVEEILESSLCRQCLDSGLQLLLAGVQRCAHCFAEDKRYPDAAVRLATCVWEMQDQSRVIAADLFNLARILTRATSAYPIPIDSLRAYCCCDARTIKERARTLRRDWLLPIGSSRQKPYGLYWCQTERDYLDWERTYRGQAVDELVTLYRLRKRNYPELAGQESLFVEQIKQELQEAIN